LIHKHQEQIRHLLAGETSYIIHDPELGWTIKPNGFTELYRANSHGIRGTREFTPIADSHSLRIATFGDSFTHGDDVPNEDTWQETLMRAQLGIEVLNFGVGGFGIDQAYLRYLKEGRRFRPHVVLIGFMSENIARSVNVFRPYYRPHTDTPLSKPRFTVTDGALRLAPNPLPDLGDYRLLMESPAPMLKALGTNDWFAHHRYRRSRWDLLPSVRLFKIMTLKFRMDNAFSYSPDTEAFQVSLEVLTQFYRTVEADHAQPFILLFPNGFDYSQVSQGLAKRYTPLFDALIKRGMRVIDLGNALDLQHPSPEVAEIFRRGHYTKDGNRLVAEYLRDVLAKSLEKDASPVNHKVPTGHS
jgi:hypothetical protein